MADANEARFCARCGSGLPPGARFCPACAAPVSGVQTVRPGNTGPAAGPGEIPPEAQAAKRIQSRYARRARIAMVVLAIFCALFLLLTFTTDMESEAQNRALTFLLCFFAFYDIVVISFFYGFRRRAVRKAGIDPKKFSGLLALHASLTAAKRQWDRNAARQMRASRAAQQTAQAGQAGAKKSSAGSNVLFAVICLACIGIFIYAVSHFNELTGGTSGRGRTLNGVWVDAAGASTSGGMRTNAAIVLFKPNGRVYAYQQGYADSESDIIKDVGNFRGGSYGEYSISGNMITVKDHRTGTVARWKIDGNTIWIGGRKYVKGHY